MYEIKFDERTVLKDLEGALFQNTTFQFCAYEKRFDERIACNSFAERIIFRSSRVEDKIWDSCPIDFRLRGRESAGAIFRFRAREERGRESRPRLLGHKGGWAQWETRKRRGTEAEEKREGCEERGRGDDARTSCASFLRASALKREANSSLGKF